MRQRTIDDGFWRDPQLADLTQEDKATLLYLLTSPDSNIVGAYRIVPRLAAAEMGWTAEQMTNVLRRLVDLDIVWFDAPTSAVWVRIWWRHNRIALAMSPKLRDRALAQIAELPPTWRQDFADDMARHGYPIDRVSIGYPYCIDTAPPNSNSNSNVAVAPRACAREQDAAAALDAHKRRRERPSGLVTWDASDVAEAERLEAENDPSAISVAVDSIAAAGREPVPGLVAAELVEMRRRAEHQARQVAADAAHRQRLANASHVPLDPAVSAVALEAYPGLAALRTRRKTTT